MEPQKKPDIGALLGVRQSRLRRVFSLRSLLIMCTLGLAAYGLWRFEAAGEGPPVAYNFVTEPVLRTDLTVRVTATGTVQPTNKVDVSSELSGVIRTVHVDFNSFVRKGDLLAELDTTRLQASLESSKARLAAARAAVRDAMVSQQERKAVYERRKSLQTHNAASAQDVDTARAAYERAVVAIEAAQANVEMSEAQLRLDETNLSRARIVSPIDGVVLMRKVDSGQTVASSLQAPVLFTIAEDLRRMEIQVDVDEADVGRVKEMQTALFTVDAYPNRKFPAQIRMVRFGSEVVQGVVTYKAVLTTDNGDLSLRPGMTATAEVVVEQIRNALTVPNQALRFQMPQQNNQAQGQSWLSRLLPRSGPPQFRPPSAQRSTAAAGRIYVLRDRQPVPVRVAVGPSDGQVTQIVRGEIAEGDSVIIDASQRRR
jgi:HlyD family secretion protein